MDSELSLEEAPFSEQDAELPEMVPVSIHTTLPEFQHCKVERVLTGLLLTWKEFLQLFDVRFEPADYVIRGNGIEADLNQTIGDYVATFKRKLKIYSVKLERLNDTPGETIKGLRSSTAQAFTSTTSTRPMRKMKLLDEEKRKRSYRKSSNSNEPTLMERIAQSVVQGQQPATSKRGSAFMGERKSSLAKSHTSSAPNSEKDFQRSSYSQQGGKANLKRLSTDLNMSNSSNSGRRLRKPKRSRALTSRRNTKESVHSVMSHESDELESSESDLDQEPAKEKKKLLKENVIKMLQETVSVRSFLRIRNELMTLRDQEKYLKITTVAPLVSGVMSLVFLRNVDVIAK